MKFHPKGFHPNITSVSVIKKGTFGGTYFRDIYSRVNNKWYKNSCKEFEELKDIDKKYHSSDFYDANLIYYKVEVGTFFEILGKKRMD